MGHNIMIRQAFPMVICAIALACFLGLDSSFAMGRARAREPELLFDSLGRDPDVDALRIPMMVAEPKPFRSLNYIEVSIRNEGETELFRARLNRSSHANPVPPGAFGVYPVGQKAPLKPADMISTGVNGQRDVSHDHATLLSASQAVETNGMLDIMWVVRPNDWPAGVYRLFGKAVAGGRKDGTWVHLASFDYGLDGVPSVLFVRQCNVTPILVDGATGRTISTQVIGMIKIVRLQREKAEGVVRGAANAPAQEYDYEVSGEKEVSLSGLAEATLVLEPGFYRLEHNSVNGTPPAGFYGESQVFQAREGESIDVRLMIHPAI